MYKLFFLLPLLIISRFSDAQQRYCKEVRTDTALLVNLSLRAQQRTTAPAAVNRVVNVYIHILANTTGTQLAINETQLLNEITNLQGDYASDDLCFFIAGIDTIRDTHLNTTFNADTDDPAEFDPYQVPDCINIFYVREILGTNNSCSPPCGIGGIALGGIPGTFCLVSSGNIGGHTISHEVGHCLGLSHTFAGINGRECINGSNSATAGDLITDTNADPYSFNSSACYSESSSGCSQSYTGDCQDPCGFTFYLPPYNNLMSYWNSCSTQIFTAGQFERVNDIVDFHAIIHDCSAPSFYTQTAISMSSGFLVRSAINTFTTSGTIQLSGSSNVVFGGKEIRILPGFHSVPGTSGETTLKPVTCN